MCHRAVTTAIGCVHRPTEKFEFRLESTGGVSPWSRSQAGQVPAFNGAESESGGNEQL